MKDKIKVLWFEVGEPSQYTGNGTVLGGWQDSLERLVKQCDNISLYVAFESHRYTEPKNVDGVWYYPINYEFTLYEKIIKQFSWKPSITHIVKEGLNVIDAVKPDLIHIFGNEWPFGMIQQYTDVPCVIHIQGCWISYFNSLYPPKYNGFTISKAIGLNLRKQWRLFRSYYFDVSRVKMEYCIWHFVKYYMGRTPWDKALVHTLNPQASYFHVEEALRPVFLESAKKWSLANTKRLNLISVGCSSYFKGMDMLLKTASILKTLKIDFSWKVVGKMDSLMQQVIEKKEHLSFSKCNVEFSGFLDAKMLSELLAESSIYVHTAYIENSPNSICEAQMIGLPIVSTYVGGISSLVHSSKGGELIPANEPWQMADAIIRLFLDKQRMQAYSVYNMELAKKRHAGDNILNELQACYNDILKNN